MVNKQIYKLILNNIQNYILMQYNKQLINNKILNKK